MEEYTKGEWKVETCDEDNASIVFEDPEPYISVYTPYGNAEANAHLIAAAPDGDKLASAVLDANFDDYDDFLELKELARKFKAKAEGG